MILNVCEISNIKNYKSNDLLREKLNNNYTEAKMITEVRPKKSIRQLIGNCAGKVDDGSIKLQLQCNWSKVLRFAPGMKFRPDELFEVFFEY